MSSPRINYVYYVYYVKLFKGIVAAGTPGQTANLTEWFNGTADIKNNKVLAINSTGGMCFGPGCSGQMFKEQSSLSCQRNAVSLSIFFNGTAMIIRVV